jgi:hypothetical protein
VAAVEVDLLSAPGEPPVGVWQPFSVVAVAERVIAICDEHTCRVAVVAVDGRSGGGKTTVADTLVAHLPNAAVVRTDDVAWYESFFDWDGSLRMHVLVPVREGRSVRYRPAAWDRRDRAGAITVPCDTQFVVVEGCGAARQSLSDLIDCVIWVQSDQAEAERRGILHDGGTEAAARFWREWEAQEIPFYAADQPGPELTSSFAEHQDCCRPTPICSSRRFPVRSAVLNDSRHEWDSVFRG